MMKNIADYSWTKENYISFRDIIFSILEDMNKCNLNLAEAELNLIHTLNDVMYDYEMVLMDRNETY
jgi:hypothetical protein